MGLGLCFLGRLDMCGMCRRMLGAIFVVSPFGPMIVGDSPRCVMSMEVNPVFTPDPQLYPFQSRWFDSSRGRIHYIE